MLEALRLSPGLEVAGVVRSTRLGAWRRCRESGLAYTLYLGCLMARRLDTRGVPVHATADANDAASRAFVERLAPELLVSAFFNQRIGAALAAAPRLAALNIHPSLLPAFRGVDPVFHARLAGAATLGVTVHRLSPELDAGDIVAQKSVAFSPEDSVLRITESLYARGADLLFESLDAVRSGAATPQAGPASYDSWPTRAQVAALRRTGVRLVRAADLLARGA